MFRIAASSAIIAFAALAVGAPALASRLVFDGIAPMKVGESRRISVYLDAEGEDINAVEGSLIFPPDILEAVSISDGNSAINFWIEEPRPSTSGRIFFSGIIPGGMNGKAFVMAVDFRAKTAGTASIGFEAARALKNDGEGSPAPLSLSASEIAVTAGARVSVPQPPADREPPEDFAPQISSTPSLFGGQLFLVFAAQDKGSGIGGYEVCEKGFACLKAQSPYLLKNQRSDSEIAVRAEDKSGNVRMATVQPLYPASSRGWGVYAVSAIIISISSILLLIMRRLWKMRAR